MAGQSARILHYHYNTMRYRVTKLERMLGEFAGDASASLRIGVALEVLRMYEVSGDTPRRSCRAERLDGG